MLLKLLPIFLVVAAAHCRSANNEDVGTVIDEIFSDQPTKGSTGNLGSIDPEILEDIFGQKPTPKREVKEKGGNSEAAVEEKVTCKLPNGEQGVCTVYYLCKGRLDSNREGSLDLGAELLSSCPTYIDICCDKKNVISMTTESKLVDIS